MNDSGSTGSAGWRSMRAKEDLDLEKPQLWILSLGKQMKELWVLSFGITVGACYHFSFQIISSRESRCKLYP
jgi:hypothetical protein